MKKKGFCLSCLCLLSVAIFALVVIGEAKAAQKEWKPDKISIINANAPGGGVDRRSRPIALQMEKLLGIPVTVENKGEAGGAVGCMYFVKNMPKDGSSLLVHWQMPFSGGIIRKAPYKMEDFATIGSYTTIVNGLFVHKDSPFKTVVEYIDYAQKHPNELSLGFLVGSSDRIISLAFVKHFNLKVREVTFNGGGPTRASLAGKHVDSIICGAETTWTALGDDARTLVLFAEERNSFNPDVPTMLEVAKESYPDQTMPGEFSMLSNWHFFATHAEVKEKYPERFQMLADTLKKTLESEAIKKIAKETFWIPRYEAPEVAQKKLEWIHSIALEYKDMFIKK